MPGVDEDRYAPAAANSPGLSPGAEIEPYDCRFSEVGDDHPGAFSVSTAVPAKVGFVFNPLRLTFLLVGIPVKSTEYWYG